jgi:hypothetical protein
MSWIPLAAETTSKTPYYVAGIALAVWAVLVAFLGITRPDFPPGPSGRAGVIAISAVLVVTTMALAVITA